MQSDMKFFYVEKFVGDELVKDDVYICTPENNMEAYVMGECQDINWPFTKVLITELKPGESQVQQRPEPRKVI